MDYAVFKTGGKQYRVKAGDTLDVEKLSLSVDSVAEFGEVLAISDGGEVSFGSPFINGAKVLAQVKSHYKDKKLIVPPVPPIPPIEDDSKDTTRTIS